MAANPERRYTLEEYLELDRTSEERLEFRDGEIFCMSSASEEHYEIESNVHSFLKTSLRARGCRVFTGNVPIKVPSAPPYRYADVSALREYLLVAQHRPHVTRLYKQGDGN